MWAKTKTSLSLDESKTCNNITREYLEEYTNADPRSVGLYEINYNLDSDCRTLPWVRGSPSRNSRGPRAKPRPKRGFGNSFQPAIDAPRLEPH
ncbi:hypothetical protein BUALT_Bualt18G0064200 [Buddleja alternifolia]|uniref:Uncharacterized protein n=1 Tax=Buddleja alternifolia TaxID=168488 RepID=A0AAV6W4X2_9LAMI|nr:hypothetical protein BUALT_Bualt18G0064200 [Buddleja alternifolia]